jgi:hypothetical protein
MFSMTPKEIRRAAFYLDGLRYSLSMADIAVKRLQPTLDNVARLHDANEDTEAQISSALLDAWSLIDMCHRARELVQSTPTLPHKLPGIQIFLRATPQIENLRQYVQHFRSGIPKLPDSWSPLWGSLSWTPTHDRATCYTILTGNLVSGITAPSISYDTHELRFTSEIVLSTGEADVDLPSIAARMATLRETLLRWIDTHPTFKRVDANTPFCKICMNPQRHEPEFS